MKADVVAELELPLGARQWSPSKARLQLQLLS